MWVIWSRYTDLESEALWGKYLAGATHLLGASCGRNHVCGTMNPVSCSIPGSATPTPSQVLRQVLPTPWASVSSSVKHIELDELKDIFWLWPFRTFSFELLKKIGNKKWFLYRYKDKLILKILFNSFSEETIVVLQPVQKRVQRTGAFRNQTYWDEFANGDRNRCFFFFPNRVGRVVFPLERIHLHVYRQELFGTVISCLQFIEYKQFPESDQIRWEGMLWTIYHFLLKHTFSTIEPPVEAF